MVGSPLGGRGRKPIAKTSYSGKWPEAVSLGPLLGLWSTDTLCLPDQVGFRASRIDRVYHPHSPGPFSSLLLLPILLGHGPKHWGSDPPSRPRLLSMAVAGASVGSVLPQGQERKHGTPGTGLLAPTSLSLFALGASAAAQVGSSAPQNQKQDSTPLSPQLLLPPRRAVILQPSPLPSPQKDKKPLYLHLGAWAPPLCASGFPAPGEGLWP